MEQEQLQKINIAYDIEALRTELAFFYPEEDFTTFSEEGILEAFNLHAERYSIEITAGELVKLSDSAIFINTPDGYQPVGDFYHKKPRKIYQIELKNGYTCRSSADHLFETLTGWKKTESLRISDILLTNNGFSQVTKTTFSGVEEVYDWEVLHENHRYWAGDGISSHNTGKTFLTLNACREAQKMGYSIIYCDSEAAVDEEVMRNFGLDPEKVRYQPVATSLEVRHFVANLCDMLRKLKEKGSTLPKLLLVLDSLGNLATTKERSDASSGSEKKDMTKQQDLRSLFRVITTDLAEFKIPFIFTNHTYAAIGSYVPGQVISGGGGAIYNASIILQLSKAGLKEDGTNKSGIIVTSKPAKNRFAKPLTIKFHISFFRGMNPYVGLEQYLTWENCGIQRGKFLTQKEVDKWYTEPSAREAIEKTRFVRVKEDGTEEVLYFEGKATSHTIAVRHLGQTIKPGELFTPRVITKELLHELDEKIIQKIFRLPEIGDLNEIEEEEIASDLFKEESDD